MLKIAICDDDVKMTGRLDTVLEEIAKRNFVKIDTEVFLDGGELEKAVEEKMYFDIIFLDIEMGDEDGITAARKILYFESHRRKIYVVTEEETLEFYGKLSEVEEELKQGKMVFLRVHQSFLVNYRHIEGLAYDYLIMDSGKRISISEDRRRMISEQYCSMEDTFYVAE